LPLFFLMLFNRRAPAGTGPPRSPPEHADLGTERLVREVAPRGRRHEHARKDRHVEQKCESFFFFFFFDLLHRIRLHAWIEARTRSVEAYERKPHNALSIAAVGDSARLRTMPMYFKFLFFLFSFQSTQNTQAQVYLTRHAWCTCFAQQAHERRQGLLC